MTTILLAEDDAAMAMGITRIMEREGWRVVIARHGGEVAALVKEHRPDLIILDVMMPKKDGFEVVRELRAAGERMPVLMLTAKAQEADKVLGLGLGADDYVTKPFGIAELVARVRAQLRRATEPTDRLARAEVSGLEMDFTRQAMAFRGRSVGLSTHESGVLRQLAARPGELVPRRALLDAVWGGDSAVTARVVDFHITNLRRKIEELTGEPEPRRILTVHGSGYKLVP